MDKQPVVNGNITAFSCGDTHIGAVNNYYSTAAMTDEDRNKLISPMVKLIKNEKRAEEAKLIQIYSKKVHGDSYLIRLDDNALVDVYKYYLLIKGIVDANAAAYKTLLAKKEQYKQTSKNLTAKRCFFCKLKK